MEPDKLFLGAVLVGDSQLVTSLGPAACQDLTAIGILHALTKTMNALSAAFMRLVCSFFSGHC